MNDITLIRGFVCDDLTRLLTDGLAISNGEGSWYFKDSNWPGGLSFDIVSGDKAIRRAELLAESLCIKEEVAITGLIKIRPGHFKEFGHGKLFGIHRNESNGVRGGKLRIEPVVIGRFEDLARFGEITIDPSLLTPSWLIKYQTQLGFLLGPELHSPFIYGRYSQFVNDLVEGRPFQLRK